MNDTWTGDIANNGDYYISLNGSTEDGHDTLDLHGRGDGDPDWRHSTCSPNPASDRVVVYSWPIPTWERVVEVVDATGRSILQVVARAHGEARMELDRARCRPVPTMSYCVACQRVIARKLVVQ